MTEDQEREAKEIHNKMMVHLSVHNKRMDTMTQTLIKVGLMFSIAPDHTDMPLKTAVALYRSALRANGKTTGKRNINPLRQAALAFKDAHTRPNGRCAIKEAYRDFDSQYPDTYTYESFKKLK